MGSSTEAEYRIIGTITRELLWLQQLLMKLDIKLTNPPNIFSDSIGATYLCENPVFHLQMKHLYIDYHFVRHIIARGELKISYAPSSHQLADLLTKSLSRSHHEIFVSMIGVVDHSSILRGRIGISSVDP